MQQTVSYVGYRMDSRYDSCTRRMHLSRLLTCLNQWYKHNSEALCGAAHDARNTRLIWSLVWHGCIFNWLCMNVHVSLMLHDAFVFASYICMFPQCRCLIVTRCKSGNLKYLKMVALGRQKCCFAAIFWPWWGVGASK